MRTNRALAMTLGLLTIVPHAGLVWFLFVIDPQLDPVAVSSGLPSSDFLELHRQSMLVGMGASLFGMLLLAFYLMFIRSRRRVPQAEKRRWALLIFFGNLLTMPVFWYLYIWKDRALEKSPTLEEYVSGAA